MTVRTNETRAKVTWNPGYGDEWRWLLPRADGRAWEPGDSLPNPDYFVVMVEYHARRCQYELVNDTTMHPTGFKQCEGTAMPGRKGCKRKGHDRGAMQ